MAGLQAKNVCTQCGLDFGRTRLPRVGGAPFCENCSRPLYERDFPGWLKGASVGLSIALAFAVYHALPYFRAGRNYYHAQKLYEQHLYAEAIPGFEAALKSGPDAKEIRLQLALAYVKNGQPVEAYKYVKDTSFEPNAEFNEMQSYFDRYDKASAKLDEAHKAYDDDNSAEAANKMREAKAIYPELQGIDDGIEAAEMGAAFDRKDYDRFIEMAQARWQRERTATTATAVASALACRYAVKGDPEVRKQAEEMLQSAASLVKTDEDRKDFDEYRERVEYRLKTREIIGTREYERRFHPSAAKKEAS